MVKKEEIWQKIDEGLIYKVSKDTFKQKVHNLNKKIKEVTLKISEDKSKELAKAKTKKQIKIINQQYKIKLAKAKYKYTLLINAFRNQELYHRGILEAEIETAKKKYVQKQKTSLTFDKNKEKAKLKKKIANLKAKYSRPVSSNYRKTRVSNFENKADIKNLKVPSSSLWIKYLKIISMIFLASLLTTLSLDVFLKPFGLYNAGLRGITQMIFYIIKHNDPTAPAWYSHALFFGFNIPFFLFGWFKISKKFTIYTTIFIAIQYLTSLIFEYSTFYENIQPFGKTPGNIYKELQENTLVDLYKYGIIFISSIIGSIFYGIGVGFVYRAGGSTGGSKFVVTFLSAKKNKSIGFFASILGIFVILLGLTVNHIIVAQRGVMETYLSATLFASLVFVFTSNYALDLTFNNSKKARLQLITNKKDEIMYFLDYYLMFDRSFTVDSVKKGHWNKKSYKFEFITHPSEINQLKKYFLKIDLKAYLVESSVKVYGRFANNWFE